TLNEARTQVNKTLQVIIQNIKALNVPELSLKTTTMSSRPVEQYKESRLVKILGYNVTNQLQVTVNAYTKADLAELSSRLIDTGLNAGASHVNGPTFFISQTKKATYYQKALTDAVLDAQKNAQALAAPFNIQLSAPCQINGSPQLYDNFNTRTYAMA